MIAEELPSEAPTPPTFARTATPDQLVAEIDRLRERLGHDYSNLRDLGFRVDGNHLVMLDCFHQLTRIFREEISGLRARVETLEVQNSEILAGIRHLVSVPFERLVRE